MSLTGRFITRLGLNAFAVAITLCLVACSAYDAGLVSRSAATAGAGAAGEQADGGTDAAMDADMDAGDSAPDVADGSAKDASDDCQPGSDRNCCTVDSEKTAPGICGCDVADTDGDSDGTPNCNDGCPNDPAKTAIGACGCGLADSDSDSDGTATCNDGCPEDPAKTAAGVCGCGLADSDSDSDGLPNCSDVCPNDPGKTAAGVCGCGVGDISTDGDQTPDCTDSCPSDPVKAVPGVCGCGTADTDSDADGLPNCNDGCPNDPAKQSAGVCGCGLADTDSDADGTPNCSDGCPVDPKKKSAGVCGCGAAETDSDSDGTLNCKDGCPADPAKTAAGVCGCGFSDGVDGCVGLRTALVHRYSFDGTGTTVTDAKGGSSGTVTNTQLSGSGTVVLSGWNQYVEMPTNMLSSLTNATVEAWVTWTGGGAWQRVFDCGNSSFNQGWSYLFLTASAGTGVGMRTAYSTNGPASETAATAPSSLPTGGIHHVAVVVNDAGNALSLYLDGVRVGNATFSGSLSSITYSSCRLGRSLFSVDPHFNGTIHELRVYNAALTPGQLQTSFNFGPGATFF